MDSTELLIWDSSKSPAFHNNILLWSDFTKEQLINQISLPLYIEEHADYYKQKYLQWVSEMGEIEINSKSIIEHLEFYNGLSYWWLASIAQKFNTSDKTEINNIIKLFALEDLVNTNNTKSLSLNTQNKNLAKTIKEFCEKKGLRYNNYNNYKFSGSLVSKYFYFFFEMKAIWLWIKYLTNSIMSLNYKIKFSAQSDVTFLDSLVHLDKKTFENGIFHSNYWTELVKELRKIGIKPNWLHNFFPHKNLPNIKSARKLLNNLNKKDYDAGVHILIEESFTPIFLLIGLKDYLKSIYPTFKIANLFLKKIQSEKFSFNFVYLLRDEWLESLRGSSKLMAHLRFKAYTNILANLPHQRLGIYLQENQPSELIFITCWKKARHGQLIGIPHSTVRYWDLRYFYDSKTYLSELRLNLPRPDKVGLNGFYAFEMYSNWNYPLSELLKLEALRYLHLKNKLNLDHSVNPSGVLRILICGDFLKSTNENMFSIISQVLNNLSDNYVVTYKPHPAFDFKYSLLPANIEINESDLSDLLEKCDIVITSNNTSAAVDSYCIGKPVIQILNGNFFNVSPLRGIKGNVFFVSNHREIIQIVEEFKSIVINQNLNYFNLDFGLYCWKKIIAKSK